MLKGVFGLSVLAALIVLAAPALAHTSRQVEVIRGSGHVVSETRPVKDLHRLTLMGSPDVYIAQGTEESLRIEAEDNLLPLVETVVREGELRISFPRPDTEARLRPTKPVKVYLTVKELNHISTLGSGDIECPALTAGELALETIGSGDIKLNAHATSLSCRLVGSGDMTLAGEAARWQVTVAGSGDFTAHDLKSKVCDLQISGSGDCRGSITTADSLSLAVAGSGDAKLSIHTKRLLCRVSGSGDISLSGAVTSQQVKLRGSGDYRARRLQCEECDIEVGGSSDAEVNVAQSLAAHLLGSGQLRYWGNPTVSLTATGSGKARHMVD